MSPRRISQNTRSRFSSVGLWAVVCSSLAPEGFILLAKSIHYPRLVSPLLKYTAHRCVLIAGHQSYSVRITSRKFQPIFSLNISNLSWPCLVFRGRNKTPITIFFFPPFVLPINVGWNFCFLPVQSAPPLILLFG